MAFITVDELPGVDYTSKAEVGRRVGTVAVKVGLRLGSRRLMRVIGGAAGPVGDFTDLQHTDVVSRSQSDGTAEW